MLPYDEQNFGSPKIILILSGKRKSGKDYIANLLLEKYTYYSYFVYLFSFFFHY